jgi:hypothetical protein
MADKNVVRQDIVQIGFDVQDGPLNDVVKEIDGLKSSVPSAMGAANDGLNKMKDTAKGATAGMDGLASATKKVQGDGIGKTAEQTKKVAQEAASAAPRISDMVKSLAAATKTKLNQIPQYLHSSATASKNFAASLKAAAKGGPFDTLKNGAKGFADVLDKGVGKAVKSLQGLGSSLGSVSKKFAELNLQAAKGIGKGIGAAAKTVASGTAKAVKASIAGTAAAIGAGAAAAYKLTDMASDLNEAQNVVEATFGAKSATQINKWSDAMAKSAGIGKTEATTMVGTMGAMMKASGVTKNLDQMSQSTVQLSGDLASFYNLDTQDAFEKIRSGISGETEPLKQLGINMSQDNLQAFMGTKAAKDLGVAYGKSFAQLSQGQQVQLRYAYLMNVTKDAQGDFAKTLKTSFANQMRVAQMNVKSLGQNIGTLLLPSVMNAVSGFNDFAEELNGIFSNGWQAGDENKLADVFSRMMAKASSAIQTGIPKIVKFAVPLVNTLVTTIVGLLPTVLTTIVSAATQVLQGIITTIQQNQSQIASAAAQIVGTLASFIISALPQIINIGVSVIISFAQGIAQQLPVLIPQALAAIQTLVQGLTAQIPTIIQTAMQIIGSLVQGLVQALPTLIPAAIQAVYTLAAGIYMQLPQLIIMGLQLILALVQGIVNALPMIIQMAVQLVVDFCNSITQNLPAIVQTAVQIIQALITGLISAIPQLIAAIPQLVQAIVGVILNTNWIDVGWQIVKGIGTGLFNGIKSLFGKGNSSGQEAAKGFNSGMLAEQPAIAGTASTLGTTAANSLALNTTQTYNTGLSGAQSFASGIQAGQSSITTAATGLGTAAQSSVNLNAASMYSSGLTSTQNLTSGLNAGTATVKTAAAGVATSAKAGLGTITTGTQQSGAQAITSLTAGMNSQTATATQDAQKTADSIKTVFGAVNLNSTGVQIMSGLAAGLKSGSGAVIAEAQRVANSIKTTINSALQVHSPSRVMIQTGAFVGQGAAIGLRQSIPTVQSAAFDVGSTIRYGTGSEETGYTPENTVANYRNSKTEYSTYAPQFNLTIAGQSASDREMEKKVRKWVKDGMQDSFEGINRKYPEEQEV